MDEIEWIKFDDLPKGARYEPDDSNPTMEAMMHVLQGLLIGSDAFARTFIGGSDGEPEQEFG